MEAPLFSVVIPTYNRSRTIGDALRSLAGQQYKSFEVIIVDDGSDDSESLQQIADGFRAQMDLRIIRHATRSNGAVARNTGIRAARGGYIAFLDSDDWWDSRKLEKCRQTLETHHWPKDWFLYSRARMVDSGGVELEVLHARALHANETVGEYLFCSGTHMPTSTIACSRELALRILFDERFIRHQDYDFCLRAAAAGAHFEYIPEILTNWRWYPLTATAPARNVSAGETPHYCEYWLEQVRPHLNRDAYFGYRMRVLAQRLRQSGQRRAYLAEVLRSFLGVSWKQKRLYFTKAARMVGRHTALRTP